MRPLEALLDGLVDYAGLFPPAALPMADAVARYADYATGAQRAMLGRFVLPVARLNEFRQAVGSRPLAEPWRLSVLAVPEDAEEIGRFNTANRGRLVIDTVEGKASRVEDIWRYASAFDEWFTVYIEVPVHEDPSVLIAELASRGLRAKVRTGGVTEEAIPAPGHVLRFIASCARQGVAFKATAGLHHPLRGEYPLTYAEDAPRGTMYGFLNIFLASALLYDGVEEIELVPLLEEREASAFVVKDGVISWRGRQLTTDEVIRARESFATSFGSCSFDEPVRDLAAINLLPTARADS